ncbi:YaaC family protein [Pseudoroseicyclus tamaricis]|uniref:YaaC-like protein n=1 Tax=Pseudoroseicyclus tamaricis TaxID=2705421 RepID=A0A6B2JZ21_9RHOB|nr:YaaC family protein [Pseudoroseicyclus tamaricis]NDV01534.1 hypothetical protein [Pseudoroseicyclus tamaricis]
MPRLPQPYDGERLQTKGRPTEFSFWPTRRLRAHAKIQTKLFALEPWGIIEKSVNDWTQGSKKLEALACLRQAHDFYKVGTEPGIEAARPLALYYCYMNLAKVLCLSWGDEDSFNNAQHGIWERSQSLFEDDFLTVFPSPNRGKLQNFSEILEVLTGSGVQTQKDLRIAEILPQVLPGHRLWAHASEKQERFISIQDIQFWRNRGDQEIWLRIYVFADDLSRLSISHKRFLSDSGLENNFHEVESDASIDGRKLLCFEEIEVTKYQANHPADSLEELAHSLRENLWATVATVPPYRRYYAYLCPQPERGSLLPQLLSVYALTYYLGSVTRYRPQDYDDILAGKYGSRFQDFVTGQPAQFLYLLSSEIIRQDIAQPSII